MSLAFLTILLGGSIRDPILWIVGVIFGWDLERGFRRSVGIFVVAGAVWGGIRVAIYLSFGEELRAFGALGLVLVCVGLMVGVGLCVRVCRGFYLRYVGNQGTY